MIKIKIIKIDNILGYKLSKNKKNKCKMIINNN